MIVCHCTGATDREIRRAARSTGCAGSAGTYCGGCCDEVTRLIDLEQPRGVPGDKQSQSEARRVPETQTTSRRSA